MPNWPINGRKRATNPTRSWGAKVRIGFWIDFSGSAVPYLMELASQMFTLGIQFSAPVLVVLLLSGLILGILARTFPQGNVFLLSFPLNIGISFTVIGLTLNLVFITLSREFDDLPNRIFTILSFLQP